MTTIQITVRLPEELVHDVDQQVEVGAVPSRAAAVTRALRRDLRRRASERDAEIYANSEPDPELEAWVTWASSHPVQLDD